MIKVSSKKNKYTYNVYHLVKAFFPNEEIIQNVDEKQESLGIKSARRVLLFHCA